jgi:hypothetical protein
MKYGRSISAEMCERKRGQRERERERELLKSLHVSLYVSTCIQWSVPDNLRGVWAPSSYPCVVVSAQSSDSMPRWAPCSGPRGDVGRPCSGRGGRAGGSWRRPGLRLGRLRGRSGAGGRRGPDQEGQETCTRQPVLESSLSSALVCTCAGLLEAWPWLGREARRHWATVTASVAAANKKSRLRRKPPWPPWCLRVTMDAQVSRGGPCRPRFVKLQNEHRRLFKCGAKNGPCV